MPKAMKYEENEIRSLFIDYMSKKNCLGTSLISDQNIQESLVRQARSKLGAKLVSMWEDHKISIEFL